MKVSFISNIMVKLGIAEYFSMGEALGIIGSMFIVLLFKKINEYPIRRYRNKDSK
jgi:hypothetical protein